MTANRIEELTNALRWMLHEYRREGPHQHEYATIGAWKRDGISYVRSWRKSGGLPDMTLTSRGLATVLAPFASFTPQELSRLLRGERMQRYLRRHAIIVGVSGQRFSIHAYDASWDGYPAPEIGYAP